MAQEPPMDVLEDIMFKFVYNLGQEYLSDPVQLLFQIERAWWYYEDTVRAEKPSLRHYATYGTFTCMLASRVSLLTSLLGDTQSALRDYQAYKVKIPVYGAILMDKDMERVLLVRGQAASSGWGFPKGKINSGEAEVDCACREVMEETGCNIESLIEPGAFIEAKGQNDKVHKLFIVVGVDPETTAFAPQLAGEIGAYGWHWLSELPATRDDADKAYIASGGKQHRFYMVQPFVSRLRTWVSKRRRSLGLPPPTWDAGASTPAASTASAFASRALQTLAASPQLTSRPSQTLLPVPAAGAGGLDRRQPSITPNAPAVGAAAAQARQGAQVVQAAQLEASKVNVVAQQQAASDVSRLPNLVLSAAFRFDTDAIMRSLAG